MQSPAFFGEEAQIGPLATIIQVAIAMRLWIGKFLTAINSSQFMPFQSYLQAMDNGMKYEDIWKSLRRDAAFVTACLCSAIISLVRVAWVMYQDNIYLFA